MAKGLKAFISVFFYVSKRIYQTRKKLQRLAGLIDFIWSTKRGKVLSDLKVFAQVRWLYDWSLNDGGFKFLEKPKDRPIWYSKLPFLQYLGPFLNFVQM